MLIAGLSQIGAIVSSLSLCTRGSEANTSIRGSIAGFYSLSGGLGILLLTKAGGALSDSFRGAGFLMMAGFNIVYLCSSLLLHRTVVGTDERRTLLQPDEE